MLAINRAPLLKTRRYIHIRDVKFEPTGSALGRAPGPRHALGFCGAQLLGCRARAGLRMSGLMLNGYTAGLNAEPRDECCA